VSRFFYILSIIIIIAVFHGSPAISSGNEEISDKKITGILVRVDVKNQTVYVKENSRIVKFKATSVLCEQFKNKINFEVDITYKKFNNRSLQIIEMVISEKKTETGKVNIKPENSVKVKDKKNR
jgi:hypothetical protein